MADRKLLLLLLLLLATAIGDDRIRTVKGLRDTRLPMPDPINGSLHVTIASFGSR